jgi:hypothetical protein
VTGKLQTYFGDASVYNQILNNTLTSFDMRLGRSDGSRETLLFDFPAIKLSSGSPAVSGKNQDVMIDAGFQAVMHATLGYTCWCSASITCRPRRCDCCRSLQVSAQLPDEFAQALHVVRDDLTPLCTLVPGLFVFLGRSRIVPFAHVSSASMQTQLILDQGQGFQRG